MVIKHNNFITQLKGGETFTVEKEEYIKIKDSDTLAIRCSDGFLKDFENTIIHNNDAVEFRDLKDGELFILNNLVCMKTRYFSYPKTHGCGENIINAVCLQNPYHLYGLESDSLVYPVNSVGVLEVE